MKLYILRKGGGGGRKKNSYENKEGQALQKPAGPITAAWSCPGAGEALHRNEIQAKYILIYSFNSNT